MHVWIIQKFQIPQFLIDPSFQGDGGQSIMNGRGGCSAHRRWQCLREKRWNAGLRQRDRKQSIGPNVFLVLQCCVHTAFPEYEAQNADQVRADYQPLNVPDWGRRRFDKPCAPPTACGKG